jgi:hypothetical protein
MLDNSRLYNSLGKEDRWTMDSRETSPSHTVAVDGDGRPELADHSASGLSYLFCVTF